MTDKRILKTKHALKSTLIEMMKKQSFQKIKVKDICEQANTSKLTFYTHYDDKYALLSEVVSDMEHEVMEKYMALRTANASGNSIVEHNRNMLKAILFVEDKYAQIFKTAAKENNVSFFMFFFEELINAFSDTEKFLLTDTVKTKYPITEISSFLITGMWGYSYSAGKKGVPDELFRAQMFDLAEDLSKSNIFIEQ